MHSVTKKSLKSSKQLSTKLDKKIKTLVKEVKLTQTIEEVSNIIQELPKNIVNKSETALNENKKSKNKKVSNSQEMEIKNESTDAEMKEIPTPKNTVKSPKSIPNKSSSSKRVIVVKNISNATDINILLSPFTKSKEIVKHSSRKARAHGVRTQLLTIEFKSTMLTKSAIAKLNDKIVDGNKLTAEYQNKAAATVRANAGTPTTVFVINNLPIDCGKDSIKSMLKDAKISTKSIHIEKNKCSIKFDKVEEAVGAYHIIKEKTIEGVKPDITFVPESDETADDVNKTKLRITNLPFSMNKRDVEKEFDMAQSVKLPLNSSRKQNGVCYLCFNSEEEAQAAHDALQDKTVGGRKIACQFALVHESKKEVERKGFVVTLFNLPMGVTVEEIIAMFANATKVSIIQKGPLFKGIAEVHFKDAEAVKAAMDLPDFCLKDRLIRKESGALSAQNKSHKNQKKDGKTKNKNVKTAKAEKMES